MKKLILFIAVIVTAPFIEGQNLLAPGTICGTGRHCESNICSRESDGRSRCQPPKANGESCSRRDISNDRECASGICAPDHTYETTCKAARNAIGERCHVDNDCASMICTRGPDDGHLTCKVARNAIGERCGESSDCASMICTPDIDGVETCKTKRNAIGMLCSDDNDCTSKICAFTPPIRWICKNNRNPNGESCTRNTDCASKRCIDYLCR